jgi:hypothetical protein
MCCYNIYSPRRHYLHYYSKCVELPL